jgi:hypothetical protein
MITNIPKPPDGSAFELVEIKEGGVPHYYCITPLHLEYCESGTLDANSIRDAERRGAKCDICRSRGLNYTFDEHTVENALVIAVEQVEDLNAIVGLAAYLSSIKEMAESLGITGFAFQRREE